MIWRERNNRHFEDLESSMEDILASLLHSLWHTLPLCHLAMRIFLPASLFLIRCSSYMYTILGLVLRFIYFLMAGLAKRKIDFNGWITYAYW